MKRTDGHIIRKKYALLFLLILTIMVVLQKYDKTSSNHLYEELKTTLDRHEKLIDYCKEEDKVYALLNQKGLSTYGDLFVVYRKGEDEEWERIYDNDFKDLKPWKIEIADIDGNGKKEILIAVYKMTHFDKEEKNRMFIFNYDGEKLYKKWTGSQISGIWTDFYVGDLLSIKGSELIFIEQREDKREQINIYYWLDFGFAFLASSESYYDIQNLSITGDNRIQITCKEEKKEETITLMVKDGKIVKTDSKSKQRNEWE